MCSEADRAAQLLAGARSVVALTGAGMSQESGVPTFRDAHTGLWARFEPSELATEEAFRRRPDVVFGWYLSRVRSVRRVLPHAGHRALVSLADRFDDLLVVTQNVDGLHQRAGSPKVVELHGSLAAFRCLDRGHPFDVRRLDAELVPEGVRVPPPECAVCGSPIRPGVVWFGEALPEGVLQRAWHAVQSCDVLLVIGTSSQVYPAADLPLIAAAAGSAVVEINPMPTALTPHAHVSWRAAAGVALPSLVERLHRSVSRS